MFLGETVFIKYWEDARGQFEGKLTCISQSGQYLLDDIVFRGGPDNHKCELIGPYAIKKKRRKWFHMNCTQNIYINNCQCSSKFNFCKCHNEDDEKKVIENDITYIITDIMKLKIVQYFLFICSFKTDDIIWSPLFYLMKENANKYNINKLLDSYIPNCQFAKTMAKQFCYGSKQNDFDYLLKVKKKKKKQINIFLQPNEVLELVNEYRKVMIIYIQNEQSQQNDNLGKGSENNIQKKPNNVNLAYHIWDESEISKTVRTQKRENRTV